MKIHFTWEEKKDKQTLDIISHPDNKNKLLGLDKLIDTNKTLLVTSPNNNRKQVILISNIESINAVGHLTKITLVDQTNYFLSQRLKELHFLEKDNLYQINQSTIINLRQIKLFQAEKHARLELMTYSGQAFIVSRHYAKIIKERLKCINN